MFGSRHDSKAAPLAESVAPRAPSTDNTPARSGSYWHSLSTMPVAQPSLLRVGATDSAHEHEAERIANALHDSNTHTTRSDAPVVATEHAPQSTREAIASPGSPLDAATRSLLEPKLGTSLRAVRVHDNAASHRANEQLDSRAFTVGRDIAFASGQYAPQTTAGRTLIAHELAHVAQQARNNQAIVQRAPALSGRKTTEKVDDSIASHVDKALEESAAITKYVDKKLLRKVSGKLDTEAPEVFASKYAKYASTRKGMPDVKDVPGFTDRDNDRIVLKARSADIEVAVHEAVHFNSSKTFDQQFGHAMNEGVTEYFTEKVLAEQKLGTGRAYRDELNLAKSFITSVGEDAAAECYFEGKLDVSRTVTRAFSGGNYSEWRKLVMSDKPEDWKKSAGLLKKVMGK